MELRYIGDYCDHFTIIVLSLAKNDPPNSDLKKNYASIVSCTKLVIIFNKPPQILVIAEQGKYLLDKSTDVDNELIKTLNFQNQKYVYITSAFVFRSESCCRFSRQNQR